VAVKNTKVVQLGRVRDLLAEWEKVRQGILAGQVDGFHTALRRGERETIYMGGVFLEDSEAAARAALKASISRMLAEDRPLPIRRVGT
jgi:hypothetical protein